MSLTAVALAIAALIFEVADAMAKSADASGGIYVLVAVLVTTLGAPVALTVAVTRLVRMTVAVGWGAYEVPSQASVTPCGSTIGCVVPGATT